MSELRKRFRLLDDLGVPDLERRGVSGARESERDRQRRRFLIAVVALLIGLAPTVLLARTLLRAHTADVVGGPATRAEFVFAAEVDRFYKVEHLTTGGIPQVINDSRPGQVDPAWSPDGKQIAFSGGVRGNTEPDDIYVMNADGSDLRQITSGSRVDLNATWSPDGTRIAFADLSGSLYVVDVGTRTVTQLTYYDNGAGTDEGPDQDPDWSPDGSKIVFSRNDERGIPSIFVMEVDGSSITRLTDPAPGTDTSPAWSPDGGRIAFIRTLDQNESRPDIYVMNADGTNIRQLTDHLADDGSPTWSPNGRQIAFSSDRDQPLPASKSGRPASVRDGNLIYNMRHMDLFTMDADGSNVTRLTTGGRLGYSPTGYGGPDWRPAVNP